MAKPFLDKGYTVFIVRHGSAPKYAVPEAVADMRRSVRFIRMEAKKFGVGPERLGAFGGSAGGHLALMLATTADDGDPKAKDEVLRHSDRVAAVVALFPPTDLRGWTTDPPEVIKKIPGLKPPLTFDAKKEPDVSPLLHVTDKTAPALMIHGDKDELVPIEHSRKMLAVMNKAKAEAKLITVATATATNKIANWSCRPCWNGSTVIWPRSNDARSGARPRSRLESRKKRQDP
jgi:acetyl esterase/lipase